MFTSGTTKIATFEDFAGSRCTRWNLHCYRGKPSKNILSFKSSEEIEADEYVCSSEIRLRKEVLWFTGYAARQELNALILCYKCVRYSFWALWVILNMHLNNLLSLSFFFFFNKLFKWERFSIKMLISLNCLHLVR